MTTTTQRVQLDKIRTDAGTQTRCVLTTDVVADYAERMAIGDAFPPVVLFHDGSEYFLADGFHRVMAALTNDEGTISAEVRKGTRLDALHYALGANCANGLRRTNADKRRCVALALENFSDQSDRQIAALCLVGADLVGSLRRELSETTVETPRTGRDGKTRRVPSKRVPRPTAQAVPEPEPEQPHVETAADVLEKNAVGLADARLAILDLEDIPANDPERAAGMALVAKWLKEHTT